MVRFKDNVTATAKQLKFTFLLILFQLLPLIGYSQLEKVIVETYYVADEFDSADTTLGRLDSGSVTYRVYVDLVPGNKLLRVYGDPNHPLKFSSTKHFYNNADGETYAKNLKKVRYGENTVALDTWLTLGQTSQIFKNKNYFGILKSQDQDGTFVGGTNNDAGLLTNSVAAMGIPLTVADGIDTMAVGQLEWSNYGLDTTMFGHSNIKSEFTSKSFYLNLKNSGMRGIDPDSNQILIAQLTTSGELSFELNLEVEQTEDGVKKLVKYVASDDTLLPGEKKNSFLKFPFPLPKCGCKDPAYLEYNAKSECTDNQKFCLNKIVLGCTDSMACNYNPKANYPVMALCCYPGSCSGRDISQVCPSIRGDSFDCNIYPNPAENSIFLDVSSGIEQDITYQIFDYSGNMVMSENLGARQSIQRMEIGLSALNNGLYLMKVNVGAQYIHKQFMKY